MKQGYQTRLAVRAALLAATIVAMPAHAHSEEHKSHSTPTAAAATAFGRAGDPAKVNRTIAIGMDDTMRYSPSSLSLRKGETVRFIVSNRGKVLHELVLGTRDDLRKHAELMRKSPDMVHHDEALAVHVKPGAKGEVVWTFDKPGEFAYACLIPGHYEAGMVGTLVVK